MTFKIKKEKMNRMNLTNTQMSVTSKINSIL